MAVAARDQRVLKGCLMQMDETAPNSTGDCAALRLGDIADPPGDVLEWALANWDEASAPCLRRLAEFAGGRRASASGFEAFCIAHIAAEKGETRAYPILTRLIAEDRLIADWLEDAVTETLPGILIRVFDGNPAPLRKAIESESGDEFARASALAALGYLVRAKGAMSDEEMRAYLGRIRRDMAPRRESVIWMTWAQTVASLGYKDMRADVAALRREGFVPDGDFTDAEFKLRIELAASDVSGLKGFTYDMIAPLEDATPALRWLAGVKSAAAGRQLHAAGLAMSQWLS